MEYQYGSDPYFTQFNVVMMSLAVLVPVLMWWLKNPRGKRAFFATDSVPILGHALSFHETKMVEFNEKMTFKALIQSGEPNYEAFVLGTRYLFISSLDTALDAMKQRPMIFRRDRGFLGWASELNVTSGVFNAEYPQWGRVRRLTSHAFAPNNMSAMTDIVVKKTEMLLADLDNLVNAVSSKSSKVINGMLPFKRYTASVIFDLAFGVEYNQYDYATTGQFFTDLDHLMLWAFKRTVNPLPNWLYKLLNAGYESITEQVIARMQSLVDKVVLDTVARNSESTSQFLNALRKASSQETDTRSALNSAEIKAQIWTFLLAGTETTAGLIESCIFILSQAHYRCLQQDLQAEVDALFGSRCEENIIPSLDQLMSLPLLAAFVKETLRLYGPVRFLFLELAGVRDFKLAGDFVIGSGVGGYCNGKD
jgi:cytochrome P450